MQFESQRPCDVREFLEGDPDPVIAHVRRAGTMGRLASHEQEDVGQEVRVRLLELERDGVGPAPGSPLSAWHDKCRRIVHAVARGVRRDPSRRWFSAPPTDGAERGATSPTGTDAAHGREDWGLSALAAVLDVHGDVLRAGERRAFGALATRCDIRAVAAALGQAHKLVAMRRQRGAVRMAASLHGHQGHHLPRWLVVATARDSRRKEWPTVWQLGVRQRRPAREIAQRLGRDERSVRRLLAAWTAMEAGKIGGFQDVGPMKPGQILFRGGL